jgi:hypothetical protein
MSSLLTHIESSRLFSASDVARTGSTSNLTPSHSYTMVSGPRNPRKNAASSPVRGRSDVSWPPIVPPP